mmetsp:Transcript_5307/g.13285  ORF Transcript_5307/g.13285 Transcript_5307/m.13285 type:complete len:115 (-) Transcript_5307:643-987(-)
MCYTEKGPELTRASVVDDLGNVIYDKLVKPERPILDYVTQFSGITAQMLQDVTTTLAQVQVGRMGEKHTMESTPPQCAFTALPLPLSLSHGSFFDFISSLSPKMTTSMPIEASK